MAFRTHDAKPQVEEKGKKGKDKKEKKERKLFQKKDKMARTFKAYPDLAAIKPKERYMFHSDYFEIDDGVATVLSFFHQEGAVDNFGYFWGVNRIPVGMPSSVTTVLFEQMSRKSERWIQEHQTRAEGIAESNANANDKNGTMTTKGKSRRRQADFEVIAQELQNGAAYVHTHYRMLVKAPNLTDLDLAVKAIERQYVDRFGTLTVAPYIGEQRREFSSLFHRNEKKMGHGFYYTSTELAGGYSLVTHGLEDTRGEYVGYMMGDVNNSAVLFDTNKYKHHVVVANENFHEKLGRAHISALWGSKLSQSCMMNNGRAIHLVLDGTRLDKLGPAFKTITTVLDMNKGDVNMFEMFGDAEDELSIFPAQMEKLILMAEQAYETTDSDRSIIRGSLAEIATKFYIQQDMWRDDAKMHRDRLRVVGIPHNEVPKLDLFVSYLETNYKATLNQTAHDEEMLHAAAVLRVSFKNMLQNNGDLFNTITSDAIDSVNQSRRVIYDFSSLMNRGKGTAMAQLVNIMAFATNTLKRGDAVIIHGTEHIDDSIKPYINMQFEKMFARGGRVCYLYNNINKMLKDRDFCEYDKADYMIFGNMTDAQVGDYVKRINQEIPPDLAKLITAKGDQISYIRRGVDNVVFRQDLALGISGRKVGMVR